MIIQIGITDVSIIKRKFIDGVHPATSHEFGTASQILTYKIAYKPFDGIMIARVSKRSKDQRFINERQMNYEHRKWPFISFRQKESTLKFQHSIDLHQIEHFACLVEKKIAGIFEVQNKESSIHLFIGGVSRCLKSINLISNYSEILKVNNKNTNAWTEL